MDKELETLWASIKLKRGRELILLIDALIGGLWGGAIASLSFVVVKRASMGTPGFWGDALEIAILPSLGTAAAYLRQKPSPDKQPDSSNAK